jgi:hypothetical protein
MGFWIEVLERLLIEVPAMGRIDKAAVSLVVRSSHEQFAMWRQDSPGFIAEFDQMHFEMLHHILRDDYAHRVVVPRPRALIEIVDYVNSRHRHHIDVDVA